MTELHLQDTWWSVRQVADKLGRDPSRVRHWIKDYNLEAQGLVTRATNARNQIELRISNKGIKKIIRENPSLFSNWKKDITNSYMDKGFVLSRDISSDKQLELLCGAIMENVKFQREQMNKIRLRTEISEHKQFALESKQDEIQNQIDRLEELRPSTAKQWRNINGYQKEYIELYRRNPYKTLRDKYSWIYGIGKESISLTRYTFAQCKLIMEWFEQELNKSQPRITMFLEEN